MKKQLILTLILSAFLALSINAQYFSRTYFNEDLGSRVLSVNTLNQYDQIISNGVFRDSSNIELHNISKIRKDGTLTVLKEFYNKWMFIFYSIQIKSNTIFYCARDIYAVNGDVHWYFGMLDTSGLLINEYKFKMPLAQNEIPLIYDLEFVKNGEVILWGEGPSPNGSQEIRERHLVWIRVKLDGTLVSGPFYFKPDWKDYSNVTNATTDIDGNMVFIYEVTDRLTGLWKEIYKIHEDDSISKIVNK